MGRLKKPRWPGPNARVLKADKIKGQIKIAKKFKDFVCPICLQVSNDPEHQCKCYPAL